jgi:hypothetical protein
LHEQRDGRTHYPPVVCVTTGNSQGLPLAHFPDLTIQDDLDIVGSGELHGCRANLLDELWIIARSLNTRLSDEPDIRDSI